MKTKLTHLWMFLLILIINSCITNNEINKQEPKFNRIDSLIINRSKSQSNTGIAVAIIQDDKIVYNKGFGYANLATKDTVTSKTMFHLGSIPKSFVSVALMQLVEQGKVNLDSLVIKYIPELKFKDMRYKNITVRHVASHSSGIFTNRNHDFDNPKTEDDALNKFVVSLDYSELRFNPGEKFSYSDTNYDIIGDIIFRVSGLPFEDYMKRYVLEPSGMSLSTFFLPDTTNVARPYIDNYNDCRISRGLVYPVNREHAPCGTLFSNTDEMCNWMITNLHKGKFESNAILNESTYDTLWKPLFETNWSSNLYEYMALGWFVGNIDGKKSYLHSGTDHGYRAIYCIIPEDKFGVVILSNYKETPIHYLLDRVLQVLYNSYKIDSRGNIINEDEYPMIVGTYSEKTNTVHISQKENLLYFTYNNETYCLSSVREGNIIAGQYYLNPNHPSYYDQANVFLSKSVDENGKVKYSIRLLDTVFEKVE